MAMQEAVEQVRVEDALLDYALEVVERTRKNERFLMGVGPGAGSC